MGVGNFFGMLPEAMQSSRLYGVEPVSYTHLEAVPTPTPEIIYVTPEPTAVPIATAPPAQADTPQTLSLIHIFGTTLVPLLSGLFS